MSLMSDQWHYARSGHQRGPVTLEALRRLVATGELATTDLVWRAGMPQWMPAADVPELVIPGAAGRPGPPPMPARIPIPVQSVGAGPSFQPVAPIGQDAGMRWLVPVGRSGWAIAAGYLGLLSLLGLFAPFAIVISIVALKDLKTHPELHGMGRAVTGLVLGIIGCVILVMMIVGFMSR